ncbi:uncharacterized protein [Typha angustifolia]|uniref:uncharacterized protein isoform X2 n=1 Tax=Typha angustifolia TaxID=59011 RepID=UPI003C2CB5FD
MAAEVDQHYSGWSHGELTGQDQSQEVPQMGVHGSISFGRYAVESLSWEKRSIFTFNRCQEELDKLKRPGLVAQKKAYFEEYYRRIRALKVLEVNPQSELTLDYAGDGSISGQSNEDELAAQVESFDDGTEKATDLREATTKVILEEEKNYCESITVNHLNFDPLLSSTKSLENFEDEKNPHYTQMQQLDTDSKSHSYTNCKDQNNLLSLDKKELSLECDISAHKNDSNFAAPESALSATSSRLDYSECIEVDNPEIRRTASFSNRASPRLKDAYGSDSTCKSQKKSSQDQKQFPKASKEDNNTGSSKAIANRVASNFQFSSVTLHKPSRGARCNVTVPRPFSFATNRRAALASNCSDGAAKLNCEASPLMDGKNARIAQDTTRKTAIFDGLANKGLKDRRDHGGVQNLPLPQTTMNTCPSGRPLKARSCNLPSCDTADLHGEVNMVPTMAAKWKKPKEGKVESRLTSAVCGVTSRTVALRQTVNSRAESPKVVSSRATNTLLDGRKTLNGELAVDRRKPRYTNSDAREATVAIISLQFQSRSHRLFHA